MVAFVVWLSALMDGFHWCSDDVLLLIVFKAASNVGYCDFLTAFAFSISEVGADSKKCGLCFNKTCCKLVNIHQQKCGQLSSWLFKPDFLNLSKNHVLLWVLLGHEDRL